VAGELTRAAHAEKPGSLVVGEIANYPKEWMPAVDGVMNFTLREIILRTAAGRCRCRWRSDDRPPGGRVRHRNLLKSWLMLDNHDTPRLATALPDEPAPPAGPGAAVHAARRAQPVLRQRGGHDRRRRPRDARADALGPRATPATPSWPGRSSSSPAQAHRALRVGDYRPITAQRLLAFERHTDRALDTVVVLANPSATSP
jgi:cyclomaltodextrinase / maltogenic alpha-amylase / neopullulanase